MKDSAKFGRNVRLRRERERLCWSQEEVAENVGTTALTVSRWERGITFPGPHFRRQLCALFGKTAVQLGLVKDGEPDDEIAAAEPRRQGVAGVAALAYGTPAALCSAPGLAAVPPLLAAPRLVGRDVLLDALRQVLVRDKSPLALALSGLPGVGKTALASAIAGDREVSSWYDGGILWAGLGPAPNILGLLGAWGTGLGIAPPEAGRLTTADEWATMLHAAIGARRMLLVIDDVWMLEDALALKVGGANCTHLLTTRSHDIALRFSGDHAIQVDELGAEDGVSLLAQLAPQVIASEPQATREIVASVGGLPLALVLIGKHLHVQARSGQPRRVRGALERLRHAEERLRLTEPQASLERPPGLPPGAPLSLQAAIEVSDRRLSPEVSAALGALSVFPAKPNCFSEEAALATTGCPAEVLDTLVDAGVLETCGPGRYTLHQTVADFARLNQDVSRAEASMVEYYVGLVQMCATQMAELDAESSNILVALEYAHELKLWRSLVAGACGSAPFLLARGLYAVAELHLCRARTAALLLGDGELQVLAARHLERVAELRGDPSRAEEKYGLGLPVVAASGDPITISRLLVRGRPGGR